jgi:hypothetical protein
MGTERELFRFISQVAADLPIEVRYRPEADAAFRSKRGETHLFPYR